MFILKKVKNYNPKAKEAFGKSLVDISVSIYKNLIILILITPITFLTTNIFKNTTIILPFINMESNSIYLIGLIFLIAILIAEWIRNTGLYYINEVE
jgi:uncharacterized protein YvpB